ncbi:MAG: respiratory nitrate reductase subunit gamma [Thermodesulfobacteriota bacterium]
MGWLEVLTYASGLVFAVGFALKIIKYFSMPMHIRWELYPIPHEGKVYGGSFFEELDHWKKERHKDHVAQYVFMVPEILFIRALYHDNRALWYWSFPFHFGLYLSIGGLALLVVGAILQMAGMGPQSSSVVNIVFGLTSLLAVVGFVMGAIGAIGLIFKRMGDPVLKDQTAPIDFFNLLWLGGIFVTGLLVWLTDPGFAISRKYLISLLTFKAYGEPLPSIHVVNLLLFAFFWAYFPFTHMTHMVSKYFMWDKVKWDDSPNLGDAGMDAKVKEYLGYPITWSAEHIGAEGGKKKWVEVATSNPFAQEPK